MSKRRGYSMERKKMIEGYLFVSVWVIGFLAFTLYPLLSSLKISFTTAKVNDLLNGTWVGFANYKTVIADPQFGSYFTDQIVRSLIDAPIISIFALISAVLLNGEIAGKRYWRAVFFTPIIISGLMIEILNSQGAANFSIFQQIGGSGIIADFIGEDTFTRMGQLLWRSCVEILIFLAGLQSISRSLYEAAQMDGATPWECFWKITLPSMSPVVILTIIYATIDSFTAPDNQIMAYIKQYSIVTFKFGPGAALSWMYFMTIIVVILAIFYIGRRFTANEGPNRH
ncbi:carbohydrate ABC transporter permease [Paenibacillus nasutitermitis]|uniref:Lactose ABC transporter permease n=1 Tax=Paenibacillus nasutitermitis TaxID=1652958 RepID=A0A916YLJ3_9BACL|nr:sugar ABC transporter permease [Paenibacillus nasutitermitis]GGD51208.1 lactose ABC transporter permease [Paenibacillus nasutitermitis]